jgi:cell division protein FtsB
MEKPFSESGAPFFPTQDAGSAPGQRAEFLHPAFIHSQLDDYGLKPSEFRVYCHVARRDGIEGAWSSVANMARVCRLHPQTVRKALRTLTEHRLLEREVRHGETTVYRVTPLLTWQPPNRIDEKPAETDTPVSVSESTPAKPIPGHPCETNAVKGAPLEGNPEKERIHTQRADNLPSSENEAVKTAKLESIPEDFARAEYNRMEAVGWIDGCQRPIRSWTHYLKKRWGDEQKQQERKTASRSSRPGGASLYELKTQLQVIETRIKEHEAQNEDDVTDDEHKEYSELRRKRQDLRRQISNLKLGDVVTKSTTRQPGDADCWWQDDLQDVKSALHGAVLQGDQTVVARLREIIKARESMSPQSWR